MGFPLQQKSITFNDLERLSLVCTVTKRLKVESRGFRCKVALYISYLHIKFEDETQWQSVRISSIILDKLAPKVKLASRLGYICNYMS